MCRMFLLSSVVWIIVWCLRGLMRGWGGLIWMGGDGKSKYAWEQKSHIEIIGNQENFMSETRKNYHAGFCYVYKFMQFIGPFYKIISSPANISNHIWHSISTDNYLGMYRAITIIFLLCPTNNLLLQNYPCLLYEYVVN